MHKYLKKFSPCFASKVSCQVCRTSGILVHYIYTQVLISLFLHLSYTVTDLPGSLLHLSDTEYTSI